MGQRLNVALLIAPTMLSLEEFAGVMEEKKNSNNAAVKDAII